MNECEEQGRRRRLGAAHSQRALSHVLRYT